MSFDLDFSVNNFDVSIVVHKICLYLLNYAPLIILAILSTLVANSNQRGNWKLMLLLLYCIVSEANNLFASRVMWSQCKIEMAIGSLPSPTCQAYRLALPNTIMHKFIASMGYFVSTLIFYCYTDDGMYSLCV